MSKSRNKFEVNGNTIKFFTEKGESFIVDLDDYLLVSKYKWSITNGYVRSNAGLLHRIITQCPKDKVVDHINHNTLDNRRSNLRICTNSENNFNRLTANSNSYTGVRGVSYKRGANSFTAQFSFNNEKYYLGTFDSLLKAQIALGMARSAISEFSECDTLNVSEEFKKQQKLREELYKKYKGTKTLPKFSLFCCGVTYKVDDLKTYQAFKCYLHKPTCEKIPNAKFCITYRFMCPRCNCVRTITYTYDNNLKIVHTYNIKKTLKAIDFLKEQVTETLIKEMDLTDMLTFKNYISKPKSNWFYGVPINEHIFKRVSLSGEECGIVPVGTNEDFLLNAI